MMTERHTRVASDKRLPPARRTVVAMLQSQSREFGAQDVSLPDGTAGELLLRTENGKVQKYKLREPGVSASTWNRQPTPPGRLTQR